MRYTWGRSLPTEVVAPNEGVLADHLVVAPNEGVLADHLDVVTVVGSSPRPP